METFKNYAIYTVGLIVGACVLSTLVGLAVAVWRCALWGCH